MNGFKAKVYGKVQGVFLEISQKEKHKNSN